MFVNPISYPGNKNQVLSQLIPLFPQDITSIVDVFCGSGVVGVNAACDQVFANDINEYTLEVFRYLYRTESSNVISDIESVIENYGLTYSRIKPKGYYKEYKHEGLSHYNKDSFLQLKNDYNRDKDIRKLITLLIYGFNHYLRFNSNGEYNVPVGKVDFSASIYSNIIKFTDAIKHKNIVFSNLDFRDQNLYQRENALYYFDPPYLVTKAPYNAIWTETEERALLQILDQLNARGERFALSNVLLSNGKENLILKSWAKDYNVFPINRQYRHANYQKVNITDTQEVLVLNY